MRRILPYIIGAIGFLWPFLSNATQRFDTLQINRGEFVTVKKVRFPALAYNRSSLYRPTNALITIRLGDTLHLFLKNNDTAFHGFSIKGTPISVTLSPSGVNSIRFIPKDQGTFLYYDSVNYPLNRYMGLGGMIAVMNDNTKAYYWNLKEHQVSFSNDISQGKIVEWSKYDPDYFTINGRSFPDLQNDSAVAIRASVGEKVYIFIANTGQSLHSLHFHGFHCEVISSTSLNIRVGWSKDTFPIKSMEGLMLQLIPDKKGKYSVHDHNLVAITAGGTHPNGMFTIMDIQ